MIKRNDLSRDYKKHRKEYIETIKMVCEDVSFSGGYYAEEFEKKFAKKINSKYASGLNNGTTALHCALLALGISKEDEVLVPANTYIATAWAVSYVGAKPVFIDCTDDTWEIDAKKIEEKITKKTKAIIGVHLYGQPFEFNEIKKIAKKYKLFIIEDCAQSHMAKYNGKYVGTLGDIGCWSFYPGKNLYTFGEGGLVSTNKLKYKNYIDIIKNQGNKKQYYHDIIGYNYRLEGIMGAILSKNLSFIDEWTKRRIYIGKRYMNEINNDLLIKQYHPKNTECVFHLFVMKTKNPRRFIKYMKDLGIECTRHYPVPCHLQKAYAFLNYKEGDCPNAEDLAKHCVDIPLFPELKNQEINYIIKACNNYK